MGRPQATRLSASGEGFTPLPPTIGSAPNLRWGLCPQASTIVNVIGDVIKEANV